MAKRTFDFSVALIGLIFLSPLLVAVGLVVLVYLGRPVLFRQKRIGYQGREFWLYKFRTMSDTRGPGGKLLPDADRLGPIGSVLRLASLDELPQLWNVLRGDMSLVGPRPLLTEYQSRYSRHQLRRYEAIPGITGWAQVNGRNAMTWERRLDRDVWYVDHWSFWLNVRILWMTAVKVFRRKGVHASEGVTMPEFSGSGPEPLCEVEGCPRQTS